MTERTGHGNELKINKMSEELSTGKFYKILRENNFMSPQDARAVEKIIWEEYDKEFPPTSYERKFKDFVEGRSKTRYNEFHFSDGIIESVVTRQTYLERRKAILSDHENQKILINSNIFTEEEIQEILNQ